MAKKTVKKTEKKEDRALYNLNKFNGLQIAINKETSRKLSALERRIDSLVDALNRSKSVRGL